MAKNSKCLKHYSVKSVSVMKTKKPAKQRKRLFEAPSHRRGRIMSVHLTSDLRTNYNSRSIPVRSGDTVRVLRGDYKGFEGRVTRVDRKGYGVFIDGINREKADGTQISVPTHPSKLEIIKLNLDDKWRKKMLERKSSVEESEQKDGDIEDNKQPSTRIGETDGET